MSVENDEAPLSCWQSVITLREQAPSRFVIYARVVEWVYTNVILEGEVTDVEALDTTEQALKLCRQRYGTGCPSFPTSVFVFRGENDELDIREQIDPKLLTALPSVDQALEGFEVHAPIISASSLVTMRSSQEFLPPSVSRVQWQQKEFVAKAPVYVSRIESYVREIRTLFSFEGKTCPFVIDPPRALITISPTDRRLCGFLLPYYKNGNLDVFRQKEPPQMWQDLSEEQRVSRLLRWFREIIAALAFLAGRGLWHGDLKPDNILVDDNESLVLTDLTQTFATSATASPEVKEHYLGTDQSVRNEGHVDFGVPSTWSLHKIVLSEVYSAGRTMFLVSERISMVQLYREYGWVNHDYIFKTEFRSGSLTPAKVQTLILRCTQAQITQRITLDQLQSELELELP